MFFNWFNFGKKKKTDESIEIKDIENNSIPNEKQTTSISQEATKTIDQIKEDQMIVDWEDKNYKIVPHFRIHELLWLPSWRVYHIPSEEEKIELIKTAEAMEKIRIFLDMPISIHCWIRPVKTNAPGTKWHKKNYNKFIGSKSKQSAHIYGKAVDFHVHGHQGPEECAKIRRKLFPKLEEWNIRMENIYGGWIHIDRNPVGINRFYIP